MTIYNMNPRLFLATARFVSTNEVHYYWRGVYVQHAQGGGLLYTSTDGHRLFHAFDSSAHMKGQARIVGISKPKFPAAWHKAESLHWESGILSNDSKTLLLPCAEIDGTFPDYAKVIPDEVSGETAQFNYTYLAEFEEIANKCDFWKPFVHHNGLGAALVTFGVENAFAVLMPLIPRLNCDPSSRPRPPLPCADMDKKG